MGLVCCCFAFDSGLHISQPSKSTLRLAGRLRQFVGVCEPVEETVGHQFLSMFNCPVVYVKPKIVFIMKHFTVNIFINS